MSPRHLRAFTLIELLVVVAIIVVLIAILMPSLGRAKKQAQEVVCLSNMRQLGLATTTYMAEYNGSFPVDLFYYLPDPQRQRALWDRELVPYLNIQENLNNLYEKPGNSKVFLCPLDARSSQAYWLTARSYTVVETTNITVSGNVINTGVVWNGDPAQTAVKIGQVSNPGMTAYIVEMHKPGDYAWTRNTQYEAAYSGITGWWGEPSIPGHAAGDFYPNGHENKMAFLFSDMHASAEDPRAAYTGGVNNWWNRTR